MPDKVDPYNYPLFADLAATPTGTPTPTPTPSAALDRLETLLQRILKAEGGYSDDPRDRGGPTNYGISQVLLDLRHRNKGKPKKSAKEVTLPEATEIYREEFWDTRGIPTLPQPLDYIVLDMAIQSDPNDAVRALQRSIGAKQDGFVGPNTIKAIKKKGLEESVKNMMAVRRKWYKELVQKDPSQAAFEEGWRNRLDAVEQYSERDLLSRLLAGGVKS